MTTLPGGVTVARCNFSSVIAETSITELIVEQETECLEHPRNQPVKRRLKAATD